MDTERGTGRTTQLMKDALEMKAKYFIVHSYAFREYCRQLMPEFPEKKIIVLDEHISTKLMGVRGPVVIDHAVWECADFQSLSKLRDILRARPELMAPTTPY